MISLVDKYGRLVVWTESAPSGTTPVVDPDDVYASRIASNEFDDGIVISFPAADRFISRWKNGRWQLYNNDLSKFHELTAEIDGAGNPTLAIDMTGVAVDPADYGALEYLPDYRYLRKNGNCVCDPITSIAFNDVGATIRMSNCLWQLKCDDTGTWHSMLAEGNPVVFGLDQAADGNVITPPMPVYSMDLSYVRRDEATLVSAGMIWYFADTGTNIRIKNGVLQFKIASTGLWYPLHAIDAGGGVIVWGLSLIGEA